MADSSILAAGAAGSAMVMLKLANDRFFVSSDLAQLFKLAKVKLAVEYNARRNITTADVFDAVVRLHAGKPMFVFEGRQVTFGEVDRLSNRVAHWLMHAGVKPFDVVALFMENRPEFVVTWLGAVKAGATCALVNHNLRGNALRHSIQVSGATVTVFGHECADAMHEISADVAPATALFCYGARTPWSGSVDAELSSASDKPVPASVRKNITALDKALLVYTSGTTGLPKAAAITHIRFFSMGRIFSVSYGVTADDRIYCVLPLYHSAGGLCGVGMAMQTGATLVLRRKFSASSFWSDCVTHKATVVQYIGELCRYLHNAAPHPDERKHSVRIAIGNGLRPEIWGPFQERFNIPEVGEFYGSTEGNAALFNHCTSPAARGSVGHMGPLLKRIMKFHIVKFDVVTEEPVRGADGFCVECGPGEPGELLGEIVEGDPLRQFAGYHGNKKATAKKVLEDVFAKGDKFFRTGDLLRHDSDGYVHFVDRIGDTFRWKGENVSTTEVAEVASVFPGVVEANVYGVEVPGQDGRACMVAVVVTEAFDRDGFGAHCREHLPAYARPLVLRILPALDVTGTFKHQKVKLRKEGMDPTLVADPLFLATTDGAFTPLTLELFDKIVAGKGPRL